MRHYSGSANHRWLQLILGVVCMILIANLQYAWTLFVAPMQAARGWHVAGIQWAFTIFIATETWLTPIEGWLVDRLGARIGPPLMVALGGLLVAVGWVVNGSATGLGGLYVGAALSGTGAGAVYATCVGNAVKWFPDRRGLAVGLTAAGFGAGAALTVIPIQMMIASVGYAATFVWCGLAQGAILLAVAPLLRGPGAGAVVSRAVPRVRQSRVSCTPGEVARSPIFWLLYAMFVVVSASGLMATAEIGPIARDSGFSNVALVFGASVLSVAMLVDSVMNGLARPFFGAVSDRIGRETTMALAFTLGAASYGLLAAFGSNPWAFVACAGLIFFTWGEIFSLFPSTCTDIFGTKYATANASLLYTAKGFSAFLVPLANLLKEATGDWYAVFVVSAIGNLLVVLAALTLLRPLHRRHDRQMARRLPSAASAAVAMAAE